MKLIKTISLLILFTLSTICISCSNNTVSKQDTSIDQDFEELIKKRQNGMSNKEYQDEFERLWNKAKETPINGSSNNTPSLKEPINFNHTIHAKDNNIHCNRCHQQGDKTVLIPSANKCAECHNIKQKH